MAGLPSADTSSGKPCRGLAIEKLCVCNVALVPWWRERAERDRAARNRPNGARAHAGLVSCRGASVPRAHTVLFRCASTGILSNPTAARPAGLQIGPRAPARGSPHLPHRAHKFTSEPQALSLRARLSSKQAKASPRAGRRHGQDQAALRALAGRPPAPRRGDQPPCPKG